MSKAKRISTPEDFTNVAVYERQWEKGKIYTIAFDNLEFSRNNQGCLVGLIKTFCMMFIGIFFLIIILAAQENAISSEMAWGIAAAVMIMGTFFYKRIAAPDTVHRALDIDFQNKIYDVLRNGRVEKSYRGKPLENLTVGPHPDTEFVRMNRQERGQKIISDIEKTHCLFGHFGHGGGETDILISRVEWPCRQSLTEVQQAIGWAAEKSVERARPVNPYVPAGDEDNAAPEPQERHHQPGGINPPLD